MKIFRTAFTLLFLSVIVVIGGCQQSQKNPPLLGDVHEHADFKVYLNGQPHNFAQGKYMSTKDKVISNFLHLHDMDGDIIHQHMSTTTLKDFFESLNMRFDANCFVTDDGTEYCNSGNKTLKMYVNGVKNNQFGDYDFNDLDRILITYGSEEEITIKKQIDSVTDKACIQSLKCPERGKPSDESTCLTGDDCILATGMEDDNEDRKSSQENTSSTEVQIKESSSSSSDIESTVKIFLIALDDNGKSGKAIGCGDSLALVERKIMVPRTESSPLSTALTQLLSLKDQKDPTTGLYNSLYQSDLKIKTITEENDKVIIELIGTYALGGACDNPRFEAQLKKTALQNSTTKNIIITINGKPLEEILSSR